jgi:hypothetical protein
MAPMSNVKPPESAPTGHPVVREALHEIRNAANLGLLNTSLLVRIWSDLSPVLESLARERPELRLGNLPVEMLLEEVPSLLSGQEEAAERIGRAALSLRELDLVPRPTP